MTPDTAAPAPPRKMLTAGRAAKEAALRARVAMTERMIKTFEAAGEIRANWLLEVLAVARAAAACADFTAALKGYELIAKNLGLIAPIEAIQKHVHLHGNAASGADLARASDAELMAKLAELSKPAAEMITEASFVATVNAAAPGEGKLFE